MAVMEYAQRAIEEEPDNPLLYVLLAQNYINLNKNDTCLKVYETAEKRGIGDFGFYLSWGMILTKLQNIKEAKEKISIALKFKENNSDALYRMGVCFYKEHDFENAKKYYNAALNAVKLTAPFRPLPPEFKGNSVDIQFTFDYNVLGASMR